MRVDPSFFALFFALVIYTASHIAEIVRGSIQAVPLGQAEAADAVALSGFQKMWFVVLPQAMRIAIPPLGNQYLNLIKNSSLGAAIGFYDLTLVAKTTVGNGSPAVPVFALDDARVHLAVARHVVHRQRGQPSDGPGRTMRPNDERRHRRTRFRTGHPAPGRSTGRRTRPGAGVWVRHNLFRTPLDGVLTVVFGSIAVVVLYKTFTFVFLTGRWEIIRVNLQLLMIGRFPPAHVLRLAVTVVGLAAWAGLMAGLDQRTARPDRHGETAPTAPAGGRPGRPVLGARARRGLPARAGGDTGARGSWSGWRSPLRW